MREVDYVFAYLARFPSLGLTYTRDASGLSGFADASWETAHSTSGWVVLWQSAALSWGSRKQKSIALSTCEAEIIALSEAAKDVVYLRKLVAGVGNWVVDEVLFHAGILPSAPCDTLSPAQVGALRASLVDVGATAVQANADSEKFPAGWLFHHRWRNQTSGTFSSPIGVIKFDTVGGRTTAWLPSAQKAGEAGKKAAAAAKRGAPEKTKPAKRAKKADAAPTPARRSGRGK